MTSNALRGCPPEHADLLAVDFSLFLVALCAVDHHVGTVQREGSALMIEIRRVPAHKCVAGGTIFPPVALHKLAGMHVRVAAETLIRSFREYGRRARTRNGR